MAWIREGEIGFCAFFEVMKCFFFETVVVNEYPLATSYEVSART